MRRRGRTNRRGKAGRGRRRRSVVPPELYSTPPVFKGIMVMAAAAVFGKLARYYFSEMVSCSIYDCDDASYQISYVTVIMIVLLVTNITAVWATLPPIAHGEGDR